jgi:DNA-binding MarR family transcriptional regulator
MTKRVSSLPTGSSRAQGATSAHATLTWIAVVRAYHLCDSVLHVRLAALGLKLAQHEVLINLLRAPGMSQQELSAHCFVAKSGMSMLITRLAALDWVVRRGDPVDARLKRLYLTAKGARLAEKARQVQVEVIAAMAESVSDAELREVGEVMQRVSGRLSKMLP